MKKKLLLITPELPYPLQSGGKVKTWNMINAFSEYWDITLVCALKENDEEFISTFIEKSPVEHFISAPVKIPRSAKNLLRSYQQAKPLNLVRTYSDTLKQQVAEIAGNFDLILLDHFETFQFLPKALFKKGAKRPTVVYHAHNAYHQIWHRYSKTTKNIAEKLVSAIESRRVKRYERRLCEKADLVFAAPNDIETLKKTGCSPEVIFRETLHLGDDKNLYLPNLDIDQTKNKLCYAGFLGWEPNVQGLLWFLENVWPSLKSVMPDLIFDIAGKAPDQRLIDAVELLDGVQLLGFVDDLEDLYKESRVCICPLLFGSGIKVKVASSLARGIPVVTTRVGVEGLDLAHGAHLMIADNAEDTIRSTIALLVSDGLWSRISKYSRKQMREKYTWDAVFNRMFSEIAEVQKADKNRLPESLCEKIAAEKMGVHSFGRIDFFKKKSGKDNIKQEVYAA